MLTQIFLRLKMNKVREFFYTNYMWKSEVRKWIVAIVMGEVNTTVNATNLFPVLFHRVSLGKDG